MNWNDLDIELANVDRTDVLDRIKTSLTLRCALEMSRPRNWWGTGIAPKRLLEIARDDGIPVAWLPEAAILKDLVSARTRDERLVVLLGRFDEILRHSAELVEECGDAWIADERTLTHQAILAAEAGHHEAAMALAVSVGEPLAIWASVPRVKVFRSGSRRDFLGTGSKKDEQVSLGESRAQLAAYRNAQAGCPPQCSDCADCWLLRSISS